MVNIPPIPPIPPRKGKNSLEVDSGKMQLVGDSASPGNNKLYGTNGSGTRGFYDLPSGGIDPDTEATLLASSPSSSGYVIATDTKRGLYYDADNTQWYITVLPLEADNGKPDIGAVQNNNKAGYKPYMIQSKALVDVTLFNTILKGGDKEIDGAIRLDWSQDPPVVQVYYNNQWNGLTVFSISEGSKLDYFDGNMTLNTYANNSNKIGANGISLTQQGQTCFGAVPAPLVIKGA